MDSSGTGESNTTGPMPIVSDYRESSEHEVHTSDVTSTNEDDFQPFALPDVVAEPANGPFAADLPLMEIPAPIPLAAYPVLDMLLYFEMEFDDPKPAVAPEPLATPDPVFEHDPIYAGIPIVDPVIADLPVDDHPADAPLIADVPAEPDVVAPLPDPVPLEPDHALFATHIDSRYAHTQNGWIDADDEYPPFVVPVAPVPAPVSVPPDIPLHPVYTTDARHMDFPLLFAQFTPPARPGEGGTHTTHTGAQESSATALPVSGSDSPCYFAAPSTVVTGLCRTSLGTGAADGFLVAFPESHGGGLAPFASFVLFPFPPPPPPSV
ncbi:calphotin-like [Helianthus annuus]|uniref:calphotin-like n=1 Tax=Helianthus annuus TaxID=4232 RepID=UPI000B8FA65D|nr:calphotin-like [Helianthus annuus]